MSYWHLLEPSPKDWHWADLDWQMDHVAKMESEVNLSIGWRQPHYPECHAPDWAKQLTPQERLPKILRLVEMTVKRYRNHPALLSWHLENEALNRGFGECDDYSRSRLRQELSLVKRLDGKHPVVMSLSNTWGLPLRQPRPDIYAISLYLRQHHNGRYTDIRWPAEWQQIRAAVIKSLTNRQTFIHELQAEPWGPGGTQTLSREEQDKSMNPEQFRKALDYSRRTGLTPIDLWGMEWWYWRKQHWGDSEMWQAAKEAFA